MTYARSWTAARDFETRAGARFSAGTEVLHERSAGEDGAAMFLIEGAWHELDAPNFRRVISSGCCVMCGDRHEETEECRSLVKNRS